MTNNTSNQSSTDDAAATRTTSRPSFLTRSSFQIAVPTAIQALTCSNSTTTSILGNSFQPGEYDVICGRGRRCYNHSGNQRFREFVAQHIPEYLGARTKLDKSTVLNGILEQIRRQNSGNARFVKKNKKHGWFEISDDQVREKVGHTIREAIAAIENKETE